jgi:hypothetical protein
MEEVTSLLKHTADKMCGVTLQLGDAIQQAVTALKDWQSSVAWKCNDRVHRRGIEKAFLIAGEKCVNAHFPGLDP